MPELNARALLGVTPAWSCGRDGRDLDVDAVGAEDPGGVGKGDLGEREQRVGGELSAVLQQDGVITICEIKYTMSPYTDWHQLAWSGDLLIAIWVLGINIIVRLVFKQKPPLH